MIFEENMLVREFFFYINGLTMHTGHYVKHIANKTNELVNIMLFSLTSNSFYNVIHI